MDKFCFTATGANSTTSTIPSSFAVAFYSAASASGAKLADDGRGKIIYKNYTANNQLGYQGPPSPPTNPTGGVFFTGTGTTTGSGLGIMKGPEMSEPIILAAESYFLQSEAALNGLIPGGAATAETLFNSGILASFNYLDKDKTEVVSGTRAPATEVAAYKASNLERTNNYLVNFSTAYVSTTTPAVAAGPGGVPAAIPAVVVTRPTTAAEKLEAIITQKYLAMNFLTSDEGWNEFRRTKYPVSVVGGTPATTMVSTATLSTRTDRLAGRILYPANEYSYNANNAPAGINTFTSLIFWDARGN